MEEWRKIDNFDYEISTLGNVRKLDGTEVKKHKPKDCNGYEAYWQVRLKKKSGGATNKNVHTLMMNTFKPDDRLNYQLPVKGSCKRGRPSKTKRAAMEYYTIENKKVYFKDGNRNNLNIDNLSYYNEFIRKRFGYIFNPKYNNVFYTGDALIKLIEINTNDENRSDNEAILKFLKGDESALWNLFIKYKEDIRRIVIIKLREKENKKTSRFNKKKKEDIYEFDDFYIESQIKAVNKIKKGRFGGNGSFIAWMASLVTHYIQQSWVVRKNKGLIDKTHTYISGL